jgi:four helix bundle protein
LKGVKGLKCEKGEKGKKGSKEMLDDRKTGAAQAFEDLHVYQRARELTNAIYALTRQAPFRLDRGLVDQIRRASVSIMSNIAEGFERGAKAEFIQFLFISKGSCGEVRAQLQVAHDQACVADDDYDRLHELARRVSGMLSNLIAHLQKTGYRGEKFSRPKRQVAVAAQERMDALRAAQLANIRIAEQRATERRTSEQQAAEQNAAESKDK